MDSEQIFKNIMLRTRYRAYRVLFMLIIILGVTIGFEENMHLSYSILTTTVGFIGFYFSIKLYASVPYAEDTNNKNP